jgi:hypothetical protein
MKVPYIPEELLHIILEYDGRIKYKIKSKEYVNIIHKYDERYDIIKPLLIKKMEIIKNIELDNSGSGFYFEFGFDICNSIGLVYDYNFSYKNKFEICYFDFRDGWIQIRTYL